MSLTKFVGLLAGSTLTLTGVSFGAVEATNDTTAQINELKAEIAAELSARESAPASAAASPRNGSATTLSPPSAASASTLAARTAPAAP